MSVFTAEKCDLRFFISLSLISLIFARPCSGQPKIQTDENIYKEEISLRTDRDIYITGENVWFKVYTTSALTGVPSNLSKVVYVELLDKNNFPLKQLKVKSADCSGNSVFALPDNMSTGNYIIRAYTNWMKNFSTDRFCYKSISVINPFESPDHIKLPPVQEGSYDRSITDEQGVVLEAAPPALVLKNHIVYKIKTEKEQYSEREKVKVTITATDMTGRPVDSDLSISVAKDAVVNQDTSSGFSRINMPETGKNTQEEPEFLAELEGHLISGFMRSKATDEPIRTTDLSLSFVGKTARCQFGKTDKNGEFHFLMKESGLNEVVIQPMSNDITGYYLELNQPFSGSFSKFRAAPLYLDSSKLEAINKVIIGMQVNNVYEPFSQKKSQEESAVQIPDFYGKPENTIKTADYIELTTVREVVKEIIPNVYTLKQNDKYDFKLLNKYPGQPFENKPLILLDGVPVYDFEKVLAISSRDIEKADVINTRYFMSGNIFDGIVSFVTKKGNLSVLEADNTIFRQVYEGCQNESSFYSPDYSDAKMKSSRIADYRNTLYWRPDVHTDKEGKAEVEFYTSDEPAGFTIVVEGINTEGKTGYSTAVFDVK